MGGVYGVVLGAAFFGESMFSRRTDASKLALAWLVHRLRAGGFRLFDTQFLTPHLASLGAIEIPRARVSARSWTAALQQRGGALHPRGLSAVAAVGGRRSSAGASSGGGSATSGSATSGTSQRSTQTS